MEFFTGNHIPIQFKWHLNTNINEFQSGRSKFNKWVGGGSFEPESSLITTVVFLIALILAIYCTKNCYIF